MADVQIKQVSGGEVTTPATSTDGVELDTGTVSNWISVANLATYVWGYLTSLTAKTTLVDADQIGIADSAASNVGKKITWANVMVAISAYTATLTNKSISLASNTLTATSAQLITAVSDETGTGSLVFGTTPTLTTPVINTATGLMQPRYIIKSADETVNNSAVVQNDNDFVFAIAANEKWMVEIWGVVTSASVTGDFKLAFDTPASCATYYAMSNNSSNIPAWGNQPATATPVSIAIAENTEIAIGAFNGTWAFWVVGFFYNSTNAGNIQFQWAQNTATVENTILKQNSVMRYTRIA